VAGFSSRFRNLPARPELVRAMEDQYFPKSCSIRAGRRATSSPPGWIAAGQLLDAADEKAVIGSMRAHKLQSSLIFA